jgi:hypothetical protein
MSNSGTNFESLVPSNVITGLSNPSSAAQVPVSEGTSNKNIKFQSKLTVDPRDLGMAYGSSSDQTGVLNEAIEKATSGARGGTVELDSGAIRLAGVVNLKSNLCINGQGELTLLEPIYAEGNHAGVITNELETGNSNISLMNFRLSRAGSNVQHGILLNGVTNFVADGLEIVGVPSVTSGALAISGILPGGSLATRMLSKDVRVRGCLFQSSNNFGVQLSYVTNGAITGNIFDDCYREAVGVEPEKECIATNISISGNVFTTGTVPSGGSATGVIVVTTSSEGTFSNVSVSGNSITNTAITAANSQPGINVLGINGDSKVNLTGNNIVGMNGNGISIGNASIATGGVTVVGNQIVQCNEGNNTEFSGAGISLRQAFRCTLIGNYIDGNHHTASIYESQSGAGRNLIIANHLLDTTAFKILKNSNTVAKDNYGKATGSGGRLAKAENYTMLVTDVLVGITSTAAEREITLPAAESVPAGVTYAVVDESNGAATHNIKVKCAGADTYTDAATSKLISTNNGELKQYSTGEKWQIT